MFNRYSPISPASLHCSLLGSEGFQERSTGLTPIVMSSGPEPPSTPSDNNSEVCESSSTGEPSASTTADINDVTVVSVSPQDLPYNALQDSQDEETPPEEGIHVLYSPPSNLVLRKRKGTSDRQGKSRGGKRSRHQVERDPIEENHADPLIWPPVIEGNTSQKVSSVVFSLNRVAECSRRNSIFRAMGAPVGTTLAVWHFKETTRMKLLGSVPPAHST